MSVTIARMRATEARLLGRSCESLIGICTGMIADGALNDLEITFLRAWLRQHEEIADTWPGEVIYKRVEEVLADGKVTADERDYLVQTLRELTGDTLKETGAVEGLSTRLPLDVDAEIIIPNRVFCFTGKFLFGTREACERAIVKRGGECSGITKSLNYLVIGDLASHEWAHTSHGRKIEKAMEYKKLGQDLWVVSEQQWTDAL